MRNSLLSLSVRWVACFASIFALAQSRDFGGDDFARLSPAQADKALMDFRDSRLAGDICLRIEITHKPRLGESSVPIKGILWAGFTEAGQQMRGEIFDAQGKPRLCFASTKGAKNSSVWISRGSQPATPSSEAQFAQPLAEGLLLSPFDLHLPFTHWGNTRYLATERSRGRPVHLYAALNPQSLEPNKVIFALDRTYGALVQAVCKNAKDETIRTLQVEEFSKVDEQWILGGCSVRDEATRDADILRVTEAAVGLKFPSEIFQPESLTKPAALPLNFKKL